VEPLSGRVFDVLASAASSVPGAVMPRLGSAFAAMTTPVVLVLDDVHLLHNRECRSALSVLADHVPSGSRLVLAGRTEPPVRVARLRAEGRILEIGRADLSLTREEAARLLREAEVTLDEDDVTELHRRTEGWAVGLYLAALALREGGSLGSAAASFAGDDQLVSAYVESEFLARIPRRHRVFLTRTAVLERMCGALCEALLELPGSAATLAGLARSNVLLVPLDRRGQWYRYHHLFRDMLLAELERRERPRAAVPFQGRGGIGATPAEGAGAAAGTTVPCMVCLPSPIAYVNRPRSTVRSLLPSADRPRIRVCARRALSPGSAGGMVTFRRLARASEPFARDRGGGCRAG
jgi:LuxR family transcriptional regulator, maltose regulon positive regulatory protein